MKLEKSDLPLLFSNTKISDVFFTEYLSQSNSDYIKVYLYALFLSKYNKDIKISDLSKKLALSINIIQDAFKYWEELGVITKKTSGYILNNLQEIELHKLYSPNLTASPESVKSTKKNQYRAKAIEEINNTCFQGIMSPSWYNDINLWFKKYSFDEHVMIALFKYCFDKSALHRNYVQTVAEGWHQNKIKTYTDLEIYFEKQEKLNLIKKSISKKLRLSRALTQYESAYVEKWILDYNYNFDVIEIALKKTTSKANPSFDYLDKLLSDWHDRNLKTPNDVQNFLSESKIKTKNIKNLEKSISKANKATYDQRTFEDLNSLYLDAKQALND